MPRSRGVFVDEHSTGVFMQDDRDQSLVGDTLSDGAPPATVRERYFATIEPADNI